MSIIPLGTFNCLCGFQYYELKYLDCLYDRNRLWNGWHSIYPGIKTNDEGLAMVWPLDFSNVYQNRCFQSYRDSLKLNLSKYPFYFNITLEWKSCLQWSKHQNVLCVIIQKSYFLKPIKQSLRHEAGKLTELNKITHSFFTIFPKQIKNT